MWIMLKAITTITKDNFCSKKLSLPCGHLNDHTCLNSAWHDVVGGGEDELFGTGRLGGCQDHLSCTSSIWTG